MFGSDVHQGKGVLPDMIKIDKGCVDVLSVVLC